MKRLRIKVIGESGSGLLSTGDILTKALMKMGFHMVSDREYPSLIKGGFACYTLNLSTEPIYSTSQESDILIAIDKQSLENYHHHVADGGFLIHAYERIYGIKKILKTLEERKVESLYLNGRSIAFEEGGTNLMINVILLGMLWKMVGFPYKIMEDVVKEKFASKPRLLEIDLRCLRRGYDGAADLIKERKKSKEDDDYNLPYLAPPKLSAKEKKENAKRILVHGNNTIALGAIHAGCRAYYAYPMSPASSVLTYMAKYAPKTGMIVKQAEDEISAAQFALGSMFGGTRAMTATSGGGFDLMTESVSLASMIECPLVIGIVQRPGPATGVPTFTCQSDLLLAVHGGHGEDARLVVAASNAEDAFELVQHAFNYAEEFQIPVMILSEKIISEGMWSMEPLKQNTVPIKRGLADPTRVKSEDRYAITESGVSKRWIPASGPAYYFANGDEHWVDGSLTEDGDHANVMIAKRIRKRDALLAALPEPEIIGPKSGADISFIGWGSSRNNMVDMVALAKSQGLKVNYLHFAFVYPLRTKTLKAFFEKNHNVHLIEGNHDAQLGQLIEQSAGEQGWYCRANCELNEVKQGTTKNRKLVKNQLNPKYQNGIFAGKLLKWNGRPIYIEELMSYINEHSGSKKQLEYKSV
jgi:2-oxoglutarate ferredoxin oxidoreductase subunit alpha